MTFEEPLYLFEYVKCTCLFWAFLVYVGGNVKNECKCSTQACSCKTVDVLFASNIGRRIFTPICNPSKDWTGSQVSKQVRIESQREARERLNDKNATVEARTIAFRLGERRTFQVNWFSCLCEISSTHMILCWSCSPLAGVWYLNPFLKKDLFISILSICVSACTYVIEPHAYLVPVEARTGSWFD